MLLESHKNHTSRVNPYSNRRGRGEVWDEQNRFVREEVKVKKPGYKRGNCTVFLWKLTLGLGKENPVNNEIVRMNVVSRTNIPWSGRLPHEADHEADDFGVPLTQERGFEERRYYEKLRPLSCTFHNQYIGQQRPHWSLWPEKRIDI